VLEGELFLGDHIFAKNYENLKEYNIVYILNVAMEISYQPPSHVIYHKLELEDDEAEDITRFFGSFLSHRLFAE